MFQNITGREELELEEILEIEKQMEDLKRSEITRLEQEAKKQKIREKEALIDELMFAEGDAKDILNTFAQNIANKQEEVMPLMPKVGYLFISSIRTVKYYSATIG